MKWEEYKKDDDCIVCPSYVLTDIECPKCSENIYMDMSIEYMTSPPKHDFYCFKCGWKGIK